MAEHKIFIRHLHLLFFDNFKFLGALGEIILLTMPFFWTLFSSLFCFCLVPTNVMPIWIYMFLLLFTTKLTQQNVKSSTVTRLSTVFMFRRCKCERTNGQNWTLVFEQGKWRHTKTQSISCIYSQFLNRGLNNIPTHELTSMLLL